MKTSPSIAVIDYGVVNLYSVTKALDRFTDRWFVTEDANEMSLAEALILPGVGSFKAGMQGLHVRGLIESVQAFAKSGKPILGICLGAQLLLSEGEEFGIHKGLDIIPGRVVSFPDLEKFAKIPHIGWNTIRKPNDSTWEHTIFEGIENNAQMYFVHSYILEPQMKEVVHARTIHGGHEFCSALKKGNVYGCQFHPEKSGEIGVQIINNFVSLAIN